MSTRGCYKAENGINMSFQLIINCLYHKLIAKMPKYALLISQGPLIFSRLIASFPRV